LLAAEPGARLALSFGDFASRHLNRDFGAALLAAGAPRQSRKVEPFMGFDEVDGDAAAAGRIGHAELEQSIDIAGFRIGKTAAYLELRLFLTVGTHEPTPPFSLG
jgi:hypothetical protein